MFLQATNSRTGRLLLDQREEQKDQTGGETQEKNTQDDSALLANTALTFRASHAAALRDSQDGFYFSKLLQTGIQ